MSGLARLSPARVEFHLLLSLYHSSQIHEMVISVPPQNFQQKKKQRQQRCRRPPSVLPEPTNPVTRCQAPKRNILELETSEFISAFSFRSSRNSINRYSCLSTFQNNQLILLMSASLSFPLTKQPAKLATSSSYLSTFPKSNSRRNCYVSFRLSKTQCIQFSCPETCFPCIRCPTTKLQEILSMNLSCLSQDWKQGQKHNMIRLKRVVDADEASGGPFRVCVWELVRKDASIEDMACEIPARRNNAMKSTCKDDRCLK